MNRRPFVILSALLIAIAIGPARADDAKRLALAKQLIAEVHEDDALRSSLPLQLAQMRKALAQQGQASEAVDAYMARYQTRLSAEVGRYGDTMAEAYAQAFSEDDLKAAIAFNATPVGQRFIAKRPLLTEASILAMRKLNEDVVQEVQEDMDRDKARGSMPRKL